MLSPRRVSSRTRPYSTGTFDQGLKLTLAQWCDPNRTRLVALRYPAEMTELRQHRSTKRSRQMMPALAPVHAGPAKCAALLRNRGGIDSDSRKPADAGFSQPQRLLGNLQHPLPQKRLIYQNAHFAGQVAVTTSRPSQGRIARTRYQSHRAGAKSHAHERFEQPRDVLVAQAKITMSTLSIDLDQPSIE